MNNVYVDRIKVSLPLFIGGVFMIYLAAADEAIFNIILDSIDQTRITVTAATIIAASLPMFFAVGFIKQSILHNWETIYQYERLLEKDIFWIMAIVLLMAIIAIKIVSEGAHLLNIPIIFGCVAFSAYLVIHAVGNRNKSGRDY